MAQYHLPQFGYTIFLVPRVLALLVRESSKRGPQLLSNMLDDNPRLAAEKIFQQLPYYSIKFFDLLFSPEVSHFCHRCFAKNFPFDNVGAPCSCTNATLPPPLISTKFMNSIVVCRLSRYHEPAPTTSVYKCVCAANYFGRMRRTLPRENCHY